MQEIQKLGVRIEETRLDDFDKIPKEIKYENTRKDTKKFTIHVNRKHKTCMAVFKSIANM